jgi:hypothetical protein
MQHSGGLRSPAQKPLFCTKSSPFSGALCAKPAGWKGDDTREKQVLNALFPIMDRDRTATQSIFEIIKNQPGY